jgi:hypothetical protein
MCRRLLPIKAGEGALEVGQRVQASFEKATKELAGEVAYDTLTAADTEKLAAQWLTDKLDGDEEGRLRKKPSAAAADAVGTLYDGVLEAIEAFPHPRSLRPVASDVERICSEHSLQLEHGSESYKRLARDLLYAHKKFYELIHARDANKWPKVPVAPTQGFTKAPVQSTGRNTIRNVYEAWASERRRNVPLHPGLISSGFLEYAEGLPKSGPLFPGLSPSAYTKRFGRMLDGLGLTDRGTVFHSFSRMRTPS